MEKCGNTTMECIRSVKPKRYLFLCFNVGFILIEKEYRNNDYIFCSIIFIMCMIVFINFPSLVLWYNLKPLYYDEMNIDFEKLPKLEGFEIIKKRYKNYFSYVLMVSNSSLIAILMNYWFIKTKDLESSYEVIGVTGGILQVFQLVNLCSGTTTLYMMKYLTPSEKVIPDNSIDD